MRQHYEFKVMHVLITHSFQMHVLNINLQKTV